MGVSKFPAGVGAGNFSGLTLHTATALSMAPLTSPPVVPTDLGDILVTLTDSSNPPVSVD